MERSIQLFQLPAGIHHPARGVQHQLAERRRHRRGVAAKPRQPHRNGFPARRSSGARPQRQGSAPVQPGSSGWGCRPSHSSSRCTVCPAAQSTPAKRCAISTLAEVGFSTLSSINKIRMVFILCKRSQRRSFNMVRHTLRHSTGQLMVAHAAARMASGSRGLRPRLGSCSPARMPTPSSLICTR